MHLRRNPQKFVSSLNVSLLRVLKEGNGVNIWLVADLLAGPLPIVKELDLEGKTRRVNCWANTLLEREICYCCYGSVKTRC